MNKDSIIFSTTLNYLITITLLIFAYLFLFTSNKYEQQEMMVEKYRPIMKMFHKQKGRVPNELKSVLKEMNYELITNDEADKILEDESKNIYFKRVREKDSFKFFELNGSNYLLFENHRDSFLIKDNEGVDFKENYYLIFTFLLLLFVSTFLYIKTLKKLSPLKRLRQNITKLADENYDIEIEDSLKKDEISLLIKEFKNSVRKLKDVKESRNIFIRNIMHELKTPITKGKIILSLPKSEDNSEKLKMVFNRLEALINEFAHIEELISTKKKLVKNSFYLEDLIEEAKDILMVEDRFVKEDFQNIKLNVNFKLFSIALKNLIDNGIRYSKNSEVTIKTKGEEILVINEAEPLKGSFEDYLEPFSNKSSNESFGLGLYIVFNILKANSYKMDYFHQNGKNIITIKRI